jgi:hypothetical protein
MAERRCSGVNSGRALPPSEPTLIAVTKPLEEFLNLYGKLDGKLASDAG